MNLKNLRLATSPPYPMNLRAQLITLCCIVSIISLLILSISTGVYFTNNYKSLRAEQLFIAAQLKSSQLDQSLNYLYYQSIWFRDNDVLTDALIRYFSGNKTTENWVESISSVSAFLTSSSIFSRATIYDTNFMEIYNVSNNGTGAHIPDDIIRQLTPLSSDERLPASIGTIGFLTDPVLNTSNYLMSLSLPIFGNPSIILSDSRVYGYVTIITGASSIVAVFNDTTALENSNVAIISAKYRNSTTYADGYHFVFPPYGSDASVIDIFYPLSNNSFLFDAFTEDTTGSVSSTTFFYSSLVAVGYSTCTFSLANWVAVVSQPESVFTSSTVKLTKIISGTVVGIAAVVCFVTFIMSYYIVKPIIKLKQATELISRGRGLRPYYENLSDRTSQDNTSTRTTIDLSDLDGYTNEKEKSLPTCTEDERSKSLSNIASKSIFTTLRKILGFSSRSGMLSPTSTNFIVNNDTKTVRVPVHSTYITDELTELKETFNIMADSLDEHSNLLEERVKARTKELEAAKIVAEATNEAKTVFIANISHELRTPLNGILGMTAIALEEDDNEKLQGSLKLIYRSGELLLHILTELLTFSKNVLQKTKLEKIHFCIHDIALQIKSIFGKIAKDQGVNFSILISPNLIRTMVFFGDSNRIIQVIMNLVSNALKFTPIDGNVDVRIKLLGEYDEEKSSLNNYDKVYIKEGTSFTGDNDAIPTEPISDKISFAGGSSSIHDYCSKTDENDNIKTEIKSDDSTISDYSEENIMGSYYENKNPGQELLGVPIPKPKKWVISVDVEDTGPGISPTLQKSVFEPFVQGDQTLSRQYGGTGLGLSICRQLASIMHGTMELDSTTGLGSKFTFTVPLLQERKIIFSETEKAFEDEFNFNSKKNRKVNFKTDKVTSRGIPSKAAEKNDDANTNGQTTLNAEAKSKTLKPTHITISEDNIDQHDFKVLIVEDNMVNQEVIKRLLKLEKIKTIEYAVDGQEAIDIVKKKISEKDKFDIIFMDIQMPNVDGHTATRVIRNELNYPYPIVALTAFADDSNKKECENSGMNAFLAKPIKRFELKEIIKEFQNPPNDL
ncbi:hypothetical protein TPHA_0E00250 [Tetrapisispora phaffii CBS 4417]|uniref:histidine kinase n=1 Tax=Tetrapisispora phaffii (strain ATCC 24235 / CBS 4417 / NBRC 1672 / NRRL Y-8282 / UCD 70-5) TaxID=1071381 RepID=G8BT93_TETPH|nr:hypothetical protein TPHA_0E00250 [Tetrapisispora phaffii CBS 4417]CCE63121.1 hypothetical protein TPHA_0E00250 [Tetrapisispora phaffii CBS 4417]